MLDLLREVAGFLARNLLVFACLGLGLTLRPGALRENLRREIFWRGLAIALVAVPLLTMLVVWLAPLTPLAESIMLLSAIAPGVPLLTTMVRKQGGDVELAAALSFVLTALAVLLLPITLPVIGRVAGVDYQADLGAIARRAVLPTFGALAVGLGVRRLWPRAADRAAPWVTRLYKLAIAVVLPVLLVLGVRAFAQAGGSALLIGLLLPLLIVALGHFLGGPDPRERKTLAIVSVFGNPLVALAIVTTTLQDRRGPPAMAAFLILRFVALGIYRIATRFGASRRRPAAPAAIPRRDPV